MNLRIAKLSLIERSYQSLPRGKVLISTAIGALSVATLGLTAGLIAKNEGNRIAAEQKQLRAIDTKNNIYNDFVNYNISLGIAKDIDNIRYNSAVSAKIVNDLHHAGKLDNEVTYILSENPVLSFADPATEEWFTSIKNFRT